MMEQLFRLKSKIHFDNSRVKNREGRRKPDFPNVIL